MSVYVPLLFNLGSNQWNPEASHQRYLSWVLPATFNEIPKELLLFYYLLLIQFCSVFLSELLGAGSRAISQSPEDREGSRNCGGAAPVGREEEEETKATWEGKADAACLQLYAIIYWKVPRICAPQTGLPSTAIHSCCFSLLLTTSSLHFFAVSCNQEVWWRWWFWWFWRDE